MTDHRTTTVTPGTPGTSARRPARSHPAQGGRITVAGLGITAMLGLVGAMGYRSHRAAAVQPAPTAAVSPDAAAQSLSLTPTAPIALTARPTVGRAPAVAAAVSPAPIARTNGSR